MTDFVLHLESTSDGSRLPPHTLQTTHGNRPLLVRYDLDAVRRAATPAELASRPATIWKWRELLPCREPGAAVTLGEAVTPLLPCPSLGSALGLDRLWIKDESQLPTGSFKARGMAIAVTMARQLGVQHVAAPTAGNAGGALAAYAARAGLRCTVLMPEDTPVVNQLEAIGYGARAFLVDGLIHDCGSIVAEGSRRGLWFDLSTMKEPYRLEGKKTMGLELAEQFGWRLPDAIFYPTGGGTGLIGMLKAFDELRTLGWLDPQAALPRLFACQAAGCAPIVHAFAAGAETAAPVEHAQTGASGLRVPRPFADRLILQALRRTGGTAMAIAEDDIMVGARLGMAHEGIAICPETGACIAALQQAMARGLLARDADVVVFNTGAAQKYVEAMRTPLPRLSHRDVDWQALR